MEERATFTFFRSFYEAAQKLPNKEDQADFLMSVCGYALDGVSPDIQGVPAALFMLVKPNIDASRKKAASGAIGGSRRQAHHNPQECEPEADDKQTGSKPEADGKQTPREEGSRKREEGSMDVGGITPISPKTPKSSKKPKEPKVQFATYVSMTNDEYQKLLDTYGQADTARLIEILDNYKGSSGKRYASDYRAILSWVTDRLVEEKARGRKQPTGAFASGDRRSISTDEREAYQKEFQRMQQQLERMQNE